MAGGAASEVIFFIGAVLVSTALVGALASISTDLSGSVQDRGRSLSKELSTDIDIINDPNNMTTAPLTLYVKNTGSTNLHTSITDVMLDGQISGSLTYDVLNSTNDAIWKPADVLKITVSDLSVASGDHRVRVVTEYGIEDELEFYKA